MFPFQVTVFDSNFVCLFQGGAYIPAAIATAGYTVASINNSFDRQLHGLIGFLDSPVSKNIVWLQSDRDRKFTQLAQK